MNKTQAPLSESIRFRLDNAYLNAESLFSGVVSACAGWKTTDISEDERRKLERMQHEAYSVVRSIKGIQEQFKERA